MLEFDGLEADMHIFLVDDTPGMSSLLWTYIEGMEETGEWSYQEAESGEEAFELLQTAVAPPANLVISDVEMGEMSGLDLLERAKELPHLAGTQFIIMSSDELYRREALELGADVFLAKPIESSVLQETLRDLFPKEFA